MIEKEEDLQKREVLKSLVQIPRLWLQQNLSHSFKLPGIILYNGLQETIDTIVSLRDKSDHDILQNLETILKNSIKDVIYIANDISQAQVWIGNINDILFGKADMQGNRNTDEYKKKITSKKVETQLSRYILSLVKEKEQYSLFLQEMIQHFRLTLNNWKKYLFTCYDHNFLPNTNLDLEVSHSRLKRSHRRMTGLKNSHQFILIHGEHFSFCFDYNYSYDSLLSILQSADYEKIKEKSKNELAKSKQRGKNRLTLKNLPERLKTISDMWDYC